MTIDDELVLELIKPDRDGKVGKDALILKILGNSSEIEYELEKTTYNFSQYGDLKKKFEKVRFIPMTPDITVTAFSPKDKTIQNTAIELENDIDWDFAESLRQLRKYRLNFPDTRIIIPKEFERFAPLYEKAGFRVYLWKAVRKWQCLRCGTETRKEGPVTPKCSNSKCNNNSRNEFRLVGLQNADVEEYQITSTLFG